MLADKEMKTPQPSLESMMFQMLERMTNLEVIIENKLSGIEDKLQTRIEVVSNEIHKHKTEEADIEKILKEHDKNWVETEKYIDRIHNLENNFQNLEKRVDDVKKNIDILEARPWKKIRDFIENNVGKVVVGIFVFVASIMWWLILNPSILRTIFNVKEVITK
jgi:hypothetical protein